MVSVIVAALFLTPADNVLTTAEKRAGWKLLFDGKSTKGWKNFKSDKVGAGWVVHDGMLEIRDPGQAGDIVSDEKFDWFEIQVDFNFVQKEQNSGIMFHVADTGEATWHSGPEIQIYDHKEQAGVERTGFLYQLYRSDKDSAKPAGQWNHFHIRIAKDKCWTDVNGVRYYEWKYGSKDFWDKVTKAKFNEHPEFGKLDKGRIAIQGDHGLVQFKNIKIKVVK